MLAYDVEGDWLRLHFRRPTGSLVGHIRESLLGHILVCRLSLSYKRWMQSLSATRKAEEDIQIPGLLPLKGT
jgi:hypothetical protein